MKKIITIFFIAIANIGFGQGYPIQQNIGSGSTLVRVPPDGGFQASLINRNFVDTTAANATNIKYYPGSQIFTTLDTSLWIRNTQTTRWLRLQTSGQIINGDTINYLVDVNRPPGQLNVYGKFFNGISAYSRLLYTDSIGSGGGSSYTFPYSVVAPGSAIQLENDTTANPANYFYGRNSAGRRGWYPQSSITGVNIYNSDGTIPDNRTVEIDTGKYLFFNARGANGAIALTHFTDTTESQIYTDDFSTGIYRRYNGTNVIGEAGVFMNRQPNTEDLPRLELYGDGGIFIDTLNYTLSTTGKKIMLRDTATGLVENIDPALIGGGSGTVTSVATNNGTGITGGTITGSGTLAIDTLNIATRLQVQHRIDSLAGTISGNYGNIQINRNGAFATPASDTLNYSTANGLTVLNKLGIGTSTPSSKAILDLTSTTQGALMPRLNTTQQNAISSPATGLIIWNTDSLALVNYTGSAWLKVSQGGGGGGITTGQLTDSLNKVWRIGGNSLASSASNKIGTLSNASIYVTTNGTDRMQFDSIGRIGINRPTSTALGIYTRSFGATAVTAALYMENSGGSNILKVADNGELIAGIPSSTIKTFSSAGRSAFGSISVNTNSWIGINAGTTTIAPLMFTSGTNLTTAEAGAMEYTTPQLFFTNGGGLRQEIPLIQQSRVSTQYDNTTTTLGNVTGLTANVAAGKIYRFEAKLYTTSNVAGGIKTAIAGTATATNIIYEGLTTDAGVTTQSRATALATSVGAVTAVTAAYVLVTGTITVNAAGTITVQAAANVATGTTSVLVGSTFVLTEML